MCTEPNGNLDWYLSLNNTKASSNFVHFIFIALYIGVWQCNHTISLMWQGGDVHISLKLKYYLTSMHFSRMNIAHRLTVSGVGGGGGVCLEGSLPSHGSFPLPESDYGTDLGFGFLSCIGRRDPSPSLCNVNMFYLAIWFGIRPGQCKRAIMEFNAFVMYWGLYRMLLRIINVLMF